MARKLPLPVVTPHNIHPHNPNNVPKVQPNQYTLLSEDFETSNGISLTPVQNPIQDNIRYQQTDLLDLNPHHHIKPNSNSSLKPLTMRKGTHNNININTANRGPNLLKSQQVSSKNLIDRKNPTLSIQSKPQLGTKLLVPPKQKQYNVKTTIKPQTDDFIDFILSDDDDDDDFETKWREPLPQTNTSPVNKSGVSQYNPTNVPDQSHQQHSTQQPRPNQPINKHISQNQFHSINQNKPNNNTNISNTTTNSSSHQQPNQPYIPASINNTKLLPITVLPAAERSVFMTYPTFNSVQSQCFDALYNSTQNLTISSPTGSGKTVLFELAILNLFHDKHHPCRKKFANKAVYLAPLRALCEEKYNDFTRKFGPNTTIDLKILQFTGNNTDLTSIHAGNNQNTSAFETYATSRSLATLYNADVIITTPEKWNALSKRWRLNRQVEHLLNSIKLFMVDEIHTINDGMRGAVLEACISRFKFMQSTFQQLLHQSQSVHNDNCTTTSTTTTTKTPTTDDQNPNDFNPETLPPITDMRIIALSATIPNIEDIQTWIGGQSFKFGNDYRPIKIEQLVLPYPMGNNRGGYGNRNNNSTAANFAGGEWKFLNSLNYKLYSLLSSHSLGKPTLIFNATRKECLPASQQILKDAQLALNTNSPFITSPQHQTILNQAASQIKDKSLADLVKFGLGIHHAGLDPQDCTQVERLFLGGHIKILNTTSTLALGVNFPAYLVIIKGTFVYNSMAKRYENMSQSFILQAIGRAGRPGLETHGKAIIMTPFHTQSFYSSLDMIPVESQLLSCSNSHRIAVEDKSMPSATNTNRNAAALTTQTTNDNGRDNDSTSGSIIEHLIAEIAIQSISTNGDVFNWLTNTFLWVCYTKLKNATGAQKNTRFYLKEQVYKEFLKLYDLDCVIVNKGVDDDGNNDDNSAHTALNNNNLHQPTTTLFHNAQHLFNKIVLNKRFFFTKPHFYYLFPTQLAIIVSSNSLKHTTIPIFAKLSTILSIEDLMELILASPEYDDIKIRQGDKGLLLEVNKKAKEFQKNLKLALTKGPITPVHNDEHDIHNNSLNSPPFDPFIIHQNDFEFGLRYPLPRQSIKDLADKLKIILQCGIDPVSMGCKLQTIDLNRDRDEVLSITIRLLNAIIEYAFLTRTNCYLALKFALYLRKSCENKLWALSSLQSMSTSQSNCRCLDSFAQLNHQHQAQQSKQRNNSSITPGVPFYNGNYYQLKQSMVPKKTSTEPFFSHLPIEPPTQDDLDPTREYNYQQPFYRCNCMFEPPGTLSQLDGIGAIGNARLRQNGFFGFSQIQTGNEFEQCGLTRAACIKAQAALKYIPQFVLELRWFDVNNPTTFLNGLMQQLLLKSGEKKDTAIDSTSSTDHSFPNHDVTNQNLQLHQQVQQQKCYSIRATLHQLRENYSPLQSQPSQFSSFKKNSQIFVMVGCPDTNQILHVSNSLFGTKLNEGVDEYLLFDNINLPPGRSFVIDIIIPRGVCGCDITTQITTPGKAIELIEKEIKTQIEKQQQEQFAKTTTKALHFNEDEADSDNDDSTKTETSKITKKRNLTNYAPSIDDEDKAERNTMQVNDTIKSQDSVDRITKTDQKSIYHKPNSNQQLNTAKMVPINNNITDTKGTTSNLWLNSQPTSTKTTSKQSLYKRQKPNNNDNPSNTNIIVQINQTKAGTRDETNDKGDGDDDDDDWFSTSSALNDSFQKDTNVVPNQQHSQPIQPRQPRASIYSKKIASNPSISIANSTKEPPKSSGKVVIQHKSGAPKVDYSKENTKPINFSVIPTGSTGPILDMFAKVNANQGENNNQIDNIENASETNLNESGSQSQGEPGQLSSQHTNTNTVDISRFKKQSISQPQLVHSQTLSRESSHNNTQYVNSTPNTNNRQNRGILASLYRRDPHLAQPQTTEKTSRKRTTKPPTTKKPPPTPMCPTSLTQITQFKQAAPQFQNHVQQQYELSTTPVENDMIDNSYANNDSNNSFQSHSDVENHDNLFQQSKYLHHTNNNNNSVPPKIDYSTGGKLLSSFATMMKGGSTPMVNVQEHRNYQHPLPQQAFPQHIMATPFSSSQQPQQPNPFRPMNNNAQNINFNSNHQRDNPVYLNQQQYQPPFHHAPHNNNQYQPHYQTQLPQHYLQPQQQPVYQYQSHAPSHNNFNQFSDNNFHRMNENIPPQFPYNPRNNNINNNNIPNQPFYNNNQQYNDNNFQTNTDYNLDYNHNVNRNNQFF